MPEVADYDNEKDWMGACIPRMMDDKDFEQDQAVAACMSMWEKKSVDPSFVLNLDAIKGFDVKIGARNSAADRARVRKIRQAAQDIHATTMELEPDDEDAQPEAPAMMEGVAQMMGSMGKSAETKSPPEGHEFYGNQWTGGGGTSGSGAGANLTPKGERMIVFRQNVFSESASADSRKLKGDETPASEKQKVFLTDLAAEVNNSKWETLQNGTTRDKLELGDLQLASNITSQEASALIDVLNSPGNKGGWQETLTRAYTAIQNRYYEKDGRTFIRASAAVWKPTNWYSKIAAATKKSMGDPGFETSDEGEGLSPAYVVSTDLLISHGGAIKAIDLGDDKTEIGGYLITFGDDTTPDLSPQRDFFDKQTDFRFTFPGKSTTYFNHTMPVTAGEKQIAISKPLKYAAELTLDDIGVFAKALLDERDEYEKYLADLARQGILSWSSGTAEHLVRRTPAKNGTNHIDVWPLGLDASLTHMPADYRNQVVPLKSLGVLQPVPTHAEQAQLPTDAPEAAGDAAASTGTASEAAIKSNKPQKGETPMDPELQKLVADVAKTAAQEAAKAASAEAVKAYQLATEKPVNDPGTLTLPGTVAGIQGDGQPADRPYKSFGAFLKDVAFCSRPGVAPDGKLLAIQGAGVKALGANEAIPSEGGWLVQTDHAAEMYKKVFDSGVLASRCNKKSITTAANGMTLNALDDSSRATGSRFGGVRGYRLAEGGSIATSKPSFRRMELKLKKFAAACYATDELLNDQGLLEQIIMEAAPAELAFMVDDDIFNGLGVTGPLGILNSGALISVSAETGQNAATIVTENIVKMWARRWARNSASYAWYINQDIEPQLFTISLAVGAGGVPLFMPAGGLSGQMYSTLVGRPIIPTEFNATLGTVGDLMLIDLSQYQLIDKGGVQSASSMHVAFLTDEMIYRFIYRVDGQPLWDSPLTPYKGTGSTQSPFIALATRS